MENYYKTKSESSRIDNENIYTNLNLKNLINIRTLDFPNSGIKTLNFLSYECLLNLEELNLLNNEIEDISILTDNNIKCKKLTKVNLRENPIRTGLEVLKQKYFTDRFLYIEVFNIIEKIDKYYISLNFKDPFWDSSEAKSKDINFGFKEFYLDIFLEDLNHLWNYIDKKYTFFSCDLPLLHQQNIITKEEYDLKQQIFQLLSKLPNFFGTIYYDKNTKDSLLNFSELLIDKGYYSLNGLSIINLRDSILSFDKAEIFFYLLDIHTLKDFINFNSQKELYLSDSKLNDVKFLGGYFPLTELRILKICNTPNIRNLCELKNAKFVNLEELYLSNDDLENLSNIEMEKYPFENLKILDLSNNKINDAYAVLHFKNLKELNLSNNKISQNCIKDLVQTLECKIDLRGNYYPIHHGIKMIIGGDEKILYSN